MIELRWYVSEDGVSELQYRQKIDTNIYAGLNPLGIINIPTWAWSDWITVPIVRN